MYNLQFKIKSTYEGYEIFKEYYLFGLLHLRFLDKLDSSRCLSKTAVELRCKEIHQEHIENERDIEFRLVSINGVTQCKIIYDSGLFDLCRYDGTKLIIENWNYNKPYFSSIKEARIFYYNEMSKVYPLIIKY